MRPLSAAPRAFGAFGTLHDVAALRTPATSNAKNSHLHLPGGTGGLGELLGREATPG